MQKEAEISALFKLIDDPDEEVFNTLQTGCSIMAPPLYLT